MYELPPAAPYPTDYWPGKFLCSSGRYIYGGKITIEEQSNAASSTLFEAYCHDIPGNYTQTDGVCSRYVVGMIIDWIPNHGVTSIVFVCQDSQGINVLNQGSKCLKKSSPQKRQTCKNGYGVCGYEHRVDCKFSITLMELAFPNV